MRPSESNRRKPLISNGIESKMAGKSGLDNRIYQPFYDISKRHVEINAEKVILSTGPLWDTPFRSPSRGLFHAFPGLKFYFLSGFLKFFIFFQITCCNFQDFCYNNFCSGVWRSLVARSAGGREVAGSNPVTPTVKSLIIQGLFVVLLRSA